MAKSHVSGANSGGSEPKHLTSWVIIGLAVLAVGVGLWWYLGHGKAAAPKDAAKKVTVVEVATAQTGPIADMLVVAGQTQANAGVELRSEVTGRVVSLGFKDGERVKKGGLLVGLDDSVQRATLAQAEANFALAEANVGRYQRLVEVGAASQLQVDQAVAEEKLQAANIQMAKANLAKYRIAAPFDGVAGIAQVNIGDYIQPGQLLVALTDNDTLKITFKVPEAQATSLQAGAIVEVIADNSVGSTGPLSVPGRIDALDGRVDPESRTLQGKVVLDNSSGAMVAGQFVRVKVPVREVSDAVVVPNGAILPQGNTVFAYIIVPGKDGGYAASKTTVEVGLRSDNTAQIVRGVEAGQVVVTAGQQKLQAPLSAVKLTSPTYVEKPAAEVEELQ